MMRWAAARRRPAGNDRNTPSSVDARGRGVKKHIRAQLIESDAMADVNDYTSSK
jgi:hypothetical protein